MSRAITNSVEIDRAPDAVFEYITDLLREHEWNDQLRSVDRLTDGPLRLGSKYRVEFGRGIGDSVIEIVGFDPPSSWQTTSTSRHLDVQLAGRVVPASRGSRVMLETTLLPHWPLRLASPLLNRTMHDSWNKHLHRIKEILEAEPGGDH